MNLDNLVWKCFDKVWQYEILENNISAIPTNHPKGVVLGGQPGAGKSFLIEKIRRELNENVIVINGDDFRKYHPKYAIFQKENIKDSVIKTREFVTKMTEFVLQKASDQKYNIVIEGTFRTAEIPISTLVLLKKKHYETEILIQTCKKELSWKSCEERYRKMLDINPNEARYTSREHHDLVCKNLAKNIEKVCQSGLVDNIRIYYRTQKNKTDLTECIYNGNPIDFKKEILNNIYHRYRKVLSR